MCVQLGGKREEKNSGARPFFFLSPPKLNPPIPNEYTSENAMQQLSRLTVLLCSVSFVFFVINIFLSFYIFIRFLFFICAYLHFFFFLFLFLLCLSSLRFIFSFSFFFSFIMCLSFPFSNSQLFFLQINFGFLNFLSFSIK